MQCHVECSEIDNVYQANERYIYRTKEALAIRRIFSLVDMITKAKFSNSPYGFKIRLIG